jgi:hypothetical protein
MGNTEYRRKALSLIAILIVGTVSFAKTALAAMIVVTGLATFQMMSILSVQSAEAQPRPPFNQGQYKKATSGE